MGQRMFTLICVVLCAIMETVITAPPVFTVPSSPGRTIPVAETTPSGSSVYRVVAIDADNDILIFSITSQEPATTAKFKIGSTTGIISTITGFDVDGNEAIKNYGITIRVTDGTSSIETTLNIEVTDENDNTPVFKNYHVIRDYTKPGMIIAHIVAEDLDSGDNGKVVYKITGGNTGDAFGIDSTNGIVYTMYALQYDKQHALYKLQIEASDGGATSRTATTTLTLSLIESLGNKGNNSVRPPIWLIILALAQLFILLKKL